VHGRRLQHLLLPACGPVMHAMFVFRALRTCAPRRATLSSLVPPAPRRCSSGYRNETRRKSRCQRAKVDLNKAITAGGSRGDSMRPAPTGRPRLREDRCICMRSRTPHFSPVGRPRACCIGCPHIVDGLADPRGNFSRAHSAQTHATVRRLPVVSQPRRRCPCFLWRPDPCFV
jgi:hypothetical protein